MYTKNVFAVSGALIAAVAAVPMAKRDIVWVTETHADVVTVPVTTTVWVNPGETAHAHYGHHHHSSKLTSTIQSTVTVPAVSASTPEPAPVSSSVESTYVAPPPSSTEAAPTTSSTSTSVYVEPTLSSTSVYVAPTTSTSVYVAPTTSTSVYVAPTTSSTSVYVAPTTATSVYVAPTSTPEASTYAASTTTTEATGTSGGASYTGDITYYDVGLGSCGWTNDDSEAIVALPTGMMQAGNAVNPNNNPYCGKYINISYGGETHQAKVVDTCGGCEGGSIDLSPSLFKTVAPNGDGRVHDVEWSFSS